MYKIKIKKDGYNLINLSFDELNGPVNLNLNNNESDDSDNDLYLKSQYNEEECITYLNESIFPQQVYIIIIIIIIK
jgi:hypothetical protein